MRVGMAGELAGHDDDVQEVGHRLRPAHPFAREVGAGVLGVGPDVAGVVDEHVAHEVLEELLRPRPAS